MGSDQLLQMYLLWLELYDPSDAYARQPLEAMLIVQ